jgi:MFS family permease
MVSSIAPHLGSPLLADPEVSRHLRRNYAAHSVEGGLFMGGIAFAHPQAVLPRMVEQLGGPDWLIALAPVLLMLGFATPGLFVTHRIERLALLKPFVMLTGGLQRLPYFVAGVLLFTADLELRTTLTLVVATPLLSGLLGGVNVSAWREYVAKTIPTTKLASLWAMRFLLGGALGVLAGNVVSYVLAHHSALQAYGILHLCVFALMAASWVVLTATREPNRTSRREPRAASWWRYAGSMRADLARDVRLRFYLASRAAFGGLYVVLPFLAIHALDVAHLPESHLGRLLTCQMVGSLAGNLVAGYFGDRSGGKPILICSQVGCLAVCVAALLCTTGLQFDAVFLALGLSVGLGMVAMPTLDIEICPLAERLSYQAMIGLAYLAGMLAAALIAGLVRHLTGSFELLVLIGSAMLLCSLGLLLKVQDPRRAAR